MPERLKLDLYLQAVDVVHVLELLAAKYGAATRKTVSVQCTVTINIDGVQVDGNALNTVNRALAPVVQAQIVPLLTAAITRAKAERDTLKAAAKTEYDKLFA